ncbi:MAG: hypothetical protein MZV70_77155 [Desulfobacterales bacterium]|nr:hypothetical protein [Desulfobacterales bacterium]
MAIPNWTFPSSPVFRLGTHDLTVVIDIDDDVPEQNETNNMAEFPVSVDTPPDLTFTQAYGATPRTVTDGKNVTFWATVKNVEQDDSKERRGPVLDRFRSEHDSDQGHHSAP